MSESNILYSYRRCPYAMRARMALVAAGIQCEVHEIDFRDKPAHMIEISAKGTVPVLQRTDSTVIDESIDIMKWALEKNDAQGWLKCDLEEAFLLIAENDGPFKAALDRYKYPNRFEGENCSGARDDGERFLAKLNEAISRSGQVMGQVISIADIAIFPFIRQFANVDRDWFDALPYKPIQVWLSEHLESDIFKHIFKKHKDSPYSLI